MPQSSEMRRIEAFSHTGPTERCRADLGAIERQIEEIGAPVRVLKAEIAQIKAAIGRGRALSASNPAEFASQGGDALLRELGATLVQKITRLDDLKIKTQNLQQPLQITKSNLLALLAQRRENSLIRKEREAHLREEGRSPINLRRWIARTKTKPSVWKMLAMAEKRENQILNEICALHHLTLVSKQELSTHYARKYGKYRLRLYRRGYYLIPADEPKGRKKKSKK